MHFVSRLRQGAADNGDPLAGATMTRRGVRTAQSAPTRPGPGLSQGAALLRRRIELFASLPMTSDAHGPSGTVDEMAPRHIDEHAARDCEIRP